MLPCDAVRQADDPDAEVLEFIEATRAAGADLGRWDRTALEPAERPGRPPSRPWSMPMTPDLATPIDSIDHLRGPLGGRQLVVYGDFECPYTAAAMREIGRMLDRGATFQLVFRHFPLRDIHPHAQAGAEAAEAAARQARFWEMHDLLFGNQRRLEDEGLREYAERLGLDLERFDADRS